MIHKFIPGKTAYAKTLLLLHGAGGTEQDFIPIAHLIDADAHILAVRGEVIELGQTRFFKRISPGVFDEKDLLQRTEQLDDFISRSAIRYNFDRERVIAFGYSNGANIAASMLLNAPSSLFGAMLLHPNAIKKGTKAVDLNHTDILITAGSNDDKVPMIQTQALKASLESCGARVSLHWFEKGHRISSDELNKIIEWYQEKFRNHAM